jgi:5-methylcytosine-specific restriction endonuclease McrA
MFISLRSVSDQEILSRTSALAAQDRKLTLSLLLHLNEVELRKLYLKSGHGSMFDYCTSRLRYSEPSALRRVKTARCLARFPALYALLESGEVSLSTISTVAKILKPENLERIIARIRGKSQREVQAVVAEYEPRAALPPDRVRAVFVPVPATSAPADSGEIHLRSDGKKSSSSDGANENDREQESGAVTATAQAAVAGAARTDEAGSLQFERRALIQFSAREAVMTKLECVRSIASHRLVPNASMEQLVEFLADYFIEREDPAVRHARRESRKRVAEAQPLEKVRSARVAGQGIAINAQAGKSPRYIPARVKDEVFMRDARQCTYISPNGKRCGSTRVLQIDHKNPVARGGGNSVENLRLLCAQHNRLEAERLMGKSGPPEPRT